MYDLGNYDGRRAAGNINLDLVYYDDIDIYANNVLENCSTFRIHAFQIRFECRVLSAE